MRTVDYGSEEVIVVYSTILDVRKAAEKEKERFTIDGDDYLTVNTVLLILDRTRKRPFRLIRLC